jgi:hypothetical protein
MMSSPPMFAKPGKLIKNVRNIFMRLFADLTNRRSRRNLKVLKTLMLVPNDYKIPAISRDRPIMVRKMIVISNILNFSLKYSFYKAIIFKTISIVNYARKARLP